MPGGPGCAAGPAAWRAPLEPVTWEHAWPAVLSEASSGLLLVTCVGRRSVIGRAPLRMRARSCGNFARHLWSCVYLSSARRIPRKPLQSLADTCSHLQTAFFSVTEVERCHVAAAVSRRVTAVYSSHYSPTMSHLPAVWNCRLLCCQPEPCLKAP